MGKIIFLKYDNIMSHEYLYKVVLFGDSSTGKTNFLNKYILKEDYQYRRQTIGVDFNARLIASPTGKNIKVHFWDTSGDPRFRSITRSYYGGVAAAILMYDTSNLDSFENLPRWIDDFNLSNRHVKIPMIILGTRYKNGRVISYDTGKRFADKCKVFYDEIDLNENYPIDIAPFDILQPMWDEIWQKFVIEDNICVGVKKRDDLLMYNKPSAHTSQAHASQAPNNNISVSRIDKWKKEFRLHLGDIKEGCIIS
jgi:small GTP-binding protein